jgi:uncharacterized protein
MNLQKGKLLRLYVNEQDQYNGKPLYEAILDRCRELKVAGATVFRALEGFGETAEIHRRGLFAGDEPIVITIIERPDKAEQVLPVLQSMMNGGLVAVSDVEVLAISNGATGPFQ